MEPVRVVIGAGPNEKVPALVAEWTIRKHTTPPIEVVHTFDKNRPTAWGHPPGPLADPKNPYPDPPRADPTAFSFVRCWVPELFLYKGKAIYMDSDQIVFCDLRELWDTDMTGYDVMHTGRTDVLLIDCEKCQWDVWSETKMCKKDRSRYPTTIQGLCGHPKERIGRIDHRWDHCDRYGAGQTKLLHYTVRMRQPWCMPNTHPFEHLWARELAEALEAGFIAEDEVRHENFQKILVRHREKQEKTA